MKDRIIDASIQSLRQEGLRFSVDVLAERLRISKKNRFYNKCWGQADVDCTSLCGQHKNGGLSRNI